MIPGKLIYTATFCLCCFWAHAQNGKVLFHHVTLEEGLSEQTNSFIYKDSNGFIWISSINGLNRFDGVNIHTYTPDRLSNGSIKGENIQSSFFEDSAGKMWFCSYVAINAYHPQQDTFSNYTLVEGEEEVTGYHVFYLDKYGNLWTIVDGKSIYTFNTETKKFSFIASLRSEAARALMIEGAHGIPESIFTYMPSGPNPEILRLDDKFKLRQQDVLSDHSKALSPKKAVNDGDSVLWITDGNNLVKYNLRNNEFQYRAHQGIVTLENLNPSTLLLSIENEGLWVYDKETDSLTHQYVHESENKFSLISNKINWITVVSDGGIWASSNGNGISYAYPAKSKFEVVPLIFSETNTPLGLNGMHEARDGNVFCATRSDGLFTLNRNGQIIRKWVFNDDKSHQLLSSVFRIFSDKSKNMWICSFDGLSFIPSSGDRINHLTDERTMLVSPVELNGGSIIFGCMSGGLYQINPDEDEIKIQRIDGNKFTDVNLPILQDRNGNLWVNNKLIMIHVLNPMTLETLQSIPIEGTVEGVIEVENEQIVWIAGAQGLFKVSTHDYKVEKIFNNVNLGCSGVSNMLMDKNGILWLSCRNQIIKFDPRNEKTTTYDEYDGLPKAQINNAAACQFDNGEMWFASNGSLVKFHPGKLTLFPIKAIPQITSLLINDENPTSTITCGTTGASNISEIQKLNLSYRDNTISFIVNSLEYSAPENNKVRYILENVDRDWVVAPSGTLARYPNLRAGTFLFKVQAANSDGVYNDDIRELLITITPPFYKTWWFITLSALALLGLIIYIMYLNFSKKLELQKVRLRLYENLHDEVGSRLTSIVFMAEEVAQHNGQNPKLQQLSKVAKSIVANMRRLVWATDPENDTMQSLIQKIRMDKSMILDDKIDFHLDLDPKLSDMNLQGEIRYQITSVINEALNNISKYAEAKNVFILIGMKDNDLHLRIRDDGKGFNPEETKVDKVKSSGYGLGNMNKRIARVKGTLTINSQPGKGTTIDARIPLS